MARSSRPSRAEGTRIVVADRRWHRLVPGAGRLAARAAAAAGGAGAVVLTSDAVVRRLNARHRGRDQPTNVLSFEPPAGLCGGDVLLAEGVVRREAARAGRPPAHHMAHLVVHGCLHLRGLGHDAAGDARRMERAEARILHRLRVPNPWKPRAGDAR